MATKNIQLQDSSSNVLYPQTDADVVLVNARGTDTSLSDFLDGKLSIESETISGLINANNGNISSNTSWSVKKYKIVSGSVSIYLGADTGNYAGVALYSDFDTLDSTTFVKSYIYSDATDGVLELEIPLGVKCIAVADKVSVGTSEITAWWLSQDTNNTSYTLTTGTYLKSDGTISTGGGTSWRTTEMIATSEGEKFKYEIYTQSSIGVYACYGEDMSLLDILVASDSYHQGTYTIPSGGAYILFCDKNNALSYVYNVTESKDIMNNLIKGVTPQYKTCHAVSKPYDFSGKTAIFAGDSLVKGFTDSSNITTNNWVNKFCNSVGMTATNISVGGSAFADASNNIITQLQGTTLNTDYLFVAGGVNDAQLGYTLSSFRTAVEALCTYIDSNFTGTAVFFILPINYTKVFDSNIIDCKAYSAILMELAITHGYNVVDGSQFAFPSGTGTEASVFFGDGLHPSEIGYTLYAKALQAVVC